VAEATDGFAGEEHIPKVGMLTIGLLSMIVAAGWLPISVFGLTAVSGAGAIPKLHVSIAPFTTFGGMASSRSCEVP
jgi:hypothetical protein